MLKKALVTIWVVVLFTAIAALFWYNELVYHLPTPVPANYHAVNPGRVINVNNPINTDNTKPLFLHFFNPDCPCSRFNIASFKALVKQYQNRVNFAIVVMSKKNFSQKDIQDKIGLKLPVIFNAGLAAACGVYSTPQAVLLDAQHKLFYRGNYNISRYCTAEKTSYAKVAIMGLLQNNQNVIFNSLALQAYGCELPNCTK